MSARNERARKRGGSDVTCDLPFFAVIVRWRTVRHKRKESQSSIYQPARCLRLSICPSRQKTEQPLLSLVRAAIAVLGHLIVHEREIAVADDSAGVADLRHVANAVALVGGAAVPDLVVEHGDRARAAEAADDGVV